MPIECVHEPKDSEKFEISKMLVRSPRRVWAYDFFPFLGTDLACFEAGFGAAGFDTGSGAGVADRLEADFLSGFSAVFTGGFAAGFED